MKSFIILITFAVLIALTQASDDPHPHGAPLSIMWLSDTDNQTVKVNYTAIDNIFLHPEVANRKIISVSIIGAFRKGKSFLMDYCLRFMYANYKSVNFANNSVDNKTNWIGSHDDPLTGFSWKSGPKRHTTGIVIWSDVFLSDENGEKVAIVLMDTQGLFDSTTSATDNSRIFALGTLISSEQIFNLNGVIQENELEYLQMATAYAKFATNDTDTKSSKPFQRLIFLIRDWVSVGDYKYGSTGGRDYLKKVLAVRPEQSPTLKSVRTYIERSFDDYSCFLMPHPGLEVISDHTYDGSFSRLDSQFQSQIEHFINSLLGSYNLVRKKISGSEVTGKEFCSYVKTYFKTFQLNKIPPIVSLYEATIDSQLANYVEKATEGYRHKLKQFEDYSKPISPSYLDEVQEPAKRLAIAWFKKEKKMGSKSHEEKFEKLLEMGIDSYFKSWKENVVSTSNAIEKQKADNKRKINEFTRQEEEKLAKARKDIVDEQTKLEVESKQRLDAARQNMNLKAEEREAEIRKIEADNQKNRLKAEERMNQLMKEQEAERERIQKDVESQNRASQEELKALKFAYESRQKEMEAQLTMNIDQQTDIILQAAQEKAKENQELQDQMKRQAKNLMEEMKKINFVIGGETRKLRENLTRRLADLNTTIEDGERKIFTLTQRSIALQEEERKQSRAEFNENMRKLDALKRRN